jgi:hypothetical protein
MTLGRRIFEMQQVAAEFRRRRIRELVAILAALAGVVVIVELLSDPGFEVAGLGGLPLFTVALVIVAASLVHHIANWRCPACADYLGRLGASLCRSCGAILLAGDDPPSPDERAEHEHRLQRAVAAEVAIYRGRTGFSLLLGLIVAFLGALLLVLGDEALQPARGSDPRWFASTSSWPTLFAGLTILTGIVLIGEALWRWRSGARTYAARLRELADTGSGAGRAPLQFPVNSRRTHS